MQWMEGNTYQLRQNPGAAFYALFSYHLALADTANYWLTKQGWTEATLYFDAIVPEDHSG